MAKRQLQNSLTIAFHAEKMAEGEGWSVWIRLDARQHKLPAAKKAHGGHDIDLAELLRCYPPAIRKTEITNCATKRAVARGADGPVPVMALPCVKSTLDAANAPHETPKTANECSVTPRRGLTEGDHADFLAPIFRAWLHDEGLPLNVLADWLNAAGAVAPRGRKWTADGVQQLVQRLGLGDPAPAGDDHSGKAPAHGAVDTRRRSENP